jgi:hypothetical protein
LDDLDKEEKSISDQVWIDIEFKLNASILFNRLPSKCKFSYTQRQTYKLKPWKIITFLCAKCLIKLDLLVKMI